MKAMKLSIWLAIGAGLTLAGMSHATTPDNHAPKDPYLWLENIHGAKAMDWVKAQNTATAKRFASSAEFKAAEARILEVHESDAHIA